MGTIQILTPPLGGKGFNWAGPEVEGEAHLRG